jgi:hypothetical protein
MSFLSKGLSTGGGNYLTGKVLGNFFGGASSIPNIQTPTWTNDQNAFNEWYGKQSNLYSTQQKQLQDLLNKQRMYAMQDLTTGTGGEELRQQYNRLGLLNSGAFNQGLADKFAQIEQGTEQQLGQLGIQQTGALADLNLSGMQRQFGLEDLASNVEMQRALANAQLKSGYRGQNMQLMGSTIDALSKYFGGKG